MKYIRFYSSVDKVVDTESETPYIGIAGDGAVNTIYASKKKFGNKVKLVTDNPISYFKPEEIMVSVLIDGVEISLNSAKTYAEQGYLLLFDSYNIGIMVNEEYPVEGDAYFTSKQSEGEDSGDEDKNEEEPEVPSEE